MEGDNYYLICALPALGELGTAPPLAPAAMLEHVRESPRPRRLVEALFLSDDLVQREALLAGQVEQISPAVLTADQVHGEKPLGQFLFAGEAEAPARVAVDGIWAAYFRHAAQTAEKENSILLADWVGHEIALRNALATARAGALGLEAERYLVAPDLAGEDLNFTGLIGQWSAAPNPLVAAKVLDTARWDWLTENDAWFTFADDELVAYAAKLMLLVRWDRLSKAEKSVSPQVN